MIDSKMLGQRLRLAREKSKLSQREVSKVMGFSSAALNQYESGKRKMDALSLEKLARIYGVTAGDLFQEETNHSYWEEALRREAEGVTAIGKVGIGSLILKLKAFEELSREVGAIRKEGRNNPLESIEDNQLDPVQIGEWAANRVRNHYNLGIAPLADLKLILEAQEEQIFRLPLGKGEIIGVTLNHPEIGNILVVNEDNCGNEQKINIAYLLGRKLISEAILFSRGMRKRGENPKLFIHEEDGSKIDKTAKVFALNFLIPSEALRERVINMGLTSIPNAREVIHLCKYFRVSYRTMVERLKLKYRLDPRVKDIKDSEIKAVEARLGYRVPLNDEEERVQYLEIEDRLPRLFIEWAYQVIEEDKLSLRYVAELLGISDIELEERIEGWRIND